MCGYIEAHGWMWQHIHHLTWTTTAIFCWLLLNPGGQAEWKLTACPTRFCESRWTGGMETYSMSDQTLWILVDRRDGNLQHVRPDLGNPDGQAGWKLTACPTRPCESWWTDGIETYSMSDQTLWILVDGRDGNLQHVQPDLVNPGGRRDGNLQHVWPDLVNPGGQTEWKLTACPTRPCESWLTGGMETYSMSDQTLWILVDGNLQHVRPDLVNPGGQTEWKLTACPTRPCESKWTGGMETYSMSDQTLWIQMDRRNGNLQHVRPDLMNPGGQTESKLTACPTRPCESWLTGGMETYSMSDQTLWILVARRNGNLQHVRPDLVNPGGQTEWKLTACPTRPCESWWIGRMETYSMSDQTLWILVDRWNGNLQHFNQTLVQCNSW